MTVFDGDDPACPTEDRHGTSKDVALSLRELADKLPKQPVHLGLLQQALRGGAADIEQLRERVKDLQQFHDWAEPQVHDHGRDVLEIERLRVALRAALHPHSRECAYSKEWKRGVAPQCDCGIGALLLGEPSRDETSADEGFQARVHDWMAQCFVRPDAMLPAQRSFRFIEEALELVQASGTSREDVERLVDYVYGRPVGTVDQEIGGVMVTLAGLANSVGLSVEYAGNAELARCVENTDKIRAKDLAKPQRSPLPGSPLEPACTCGFPNLPRGTAHRRDCALYDSTSLEPSQAWKCANAHARGSDPTCRVCFPENGEASQK